MNAFDAQQAAQRDYYARTAAHYDAMHVSPDDEHGIALAAFSGFARLTNTRSVLDVGAGTGRGMAALQRYLPDAALMGVEPVAALREIGHRQGVPADQLVDGDALKLPFDDDAFDWVIETGVLHHVPDPRRAVAEMVRVARKGVMISDANAYGQGSRAQRGFKAVMRALGLWRALIWVQTGGRMAKWSEGDGVFYSYSALDDITGLATKFPRVFTMNTVQAAGTDLRRSAGQVMIVAMAG